MGAAKDTTNVGEGIHPLRYVLFGLAVICSLMSIYIFLDYQTSTEAKLSGELILGQIDTAVYPEQDSPITGFFFEYVGLMCYGLSLLFGYIGYFAFIKKFSIWTIDFYKLSLRVLGFNLLLLGLTAFFSRFGLLKSTGAGGLLGDMLNLVCDFALPPFISIVIFLIVTYFGACLFVGLSGFALFDWVGEKLFRLIYGKKAQQEANATLAGDMATANAEGAAQANPLESASVGYPEEKQRTKIILDANGNEIVGGVGFDDKGNVIDQDGNIIPDTEQTPTVKKGIRDNKTMSPEHQFRVSAISQVPNMPANGNGRLFAGSQELPPEVQAALARAQQQDMLAEQAQMPNEQSSNVAQAEFAQEVQAQATTTEQFLTQEQGQIQGQIQGQTQDQPPFTATMQGQGSANTDFFAMAQSQGLNSSNQGHQSVPTQDYMQEAIPQNIQVAQDKTHETVFNETLYNQQPLGMQGGMQGRDGLQGMAEKFGQVQAIDELPDNLPHDNTELYGADKAEHHDGAMANGAQVSDVSDMRDIDAQVHGANGASELGGARGTNGADTVTYENVEPQFNSLMPDNSYMQGASYGYGQDFGRGEPQATFEPQETPTQEIKQYTQAYDPTVDPGYDPNGQAAKMASESAPDYSEMMAQAAAAGGVLEQAGTVAQAIAQAQAQEAALAAQAAAEAKMQDKQAAKDAQNTASGIASGTVGDVEGLASQAQYQEQGQYQEQVQNSSQYMAADSADISQGQYAQHESALEQSESQSGNDGQAQNQYQFTAEHNEDEEESSPYRVGVRRRPVVQSSADSEESPYRVGIMPKDGKKTVKSAKSQSEQLEGAEKSKLQEQDVAANSGDKVESEEDKGPSTLIISSDTYGHSLAPSDFSQQKPQSQTTVITHETRSSMVSDESAYSAIGGASLTAEALASYGTKQEDKDEQAVSLQANLVSGTESTASKAEAKDLALDGAQDETKLSASESAKDKADKLESLASDISQTAAVSAMPEANNADDTTKVAEDSQGVTTDGTESGKAIESDKTAEMSLETEEDTSESIYITPGVIKNKKGSNPSAKSQEQSQGQDQESKLEAQSDKELSDKDLQESHKEQESQEESEPAVHTIIQKVDPEVFAAQQAAAKAAREKAEREEAERRAKEAAEQLAREEAERKAKEEEEARKAEQERKAQEEAKAKEEAERKQKEEAERKAKEEEEAKAKEEAEQAQEEEPLYMGTYADKLKRNQKRKIKSDKTDKDDKSESSDSGESSSVDTVVIRSSNTLTPAPITSESTDSPFAAFNAAREKAEQERKAQEEALAKIREAAAAKAKAEVEAARLAREEEERKQKEEREKQAQAEAERQAKLKEQAQAREQELARQQEVASVETDEEDEDKDSPYITPGIRNRKKKKVVESSVESIKDSEPSTIIQYSPAPSPSANASTSHNQNGESPTLGSAAISGAVGSAVDVANSVAASALAGVATGVAMNTAAGSLASMGAGAVVGAIDTKGSVSAEHEVGPDEVKLEHDDDSWDNLPKSPQHDRLSAEYQKMLSDAAQAHDGSISSLMASMSGAASASANPVDISAVAQEGLDKIDHSNQGSEQAEDSRAPSTLITTSDSSANKEHVDHFTSSFDPYNPAYVEASKNPTSQVSSESHEGKQAVALMQSEDGIEAISSDEMDKALASVRQSSVIDFTKSSEEAEQQPQKLGESDDSSFFSVAAVSQNQSSPLESENLEGEVATTIISRGEAIPDHDTLARFEDNDSSGNTAIYRASESSKGRDGHEGSVNLDVASDDSFYKYAVTSSNVQEARQATEDLESSGSLADEEHSYDFGGGHHGQTTSFEAVESKQEVRKPIRTSHFSFTDMAREEEERKRLVALDHDDSEAEGRYGQESGYDQRIEQAQEPSEGAVETQKTATSQQSQDSELDSIVQGVQVGANPASAESPTYMQAQAQVQTHAPSHIMGAYSQKHSVESENARSVERTKENIISFTNFTSKEQDKSSYEVNRLTSAFIPMDEEEGLVSGNTEISQRPFESKGYEAERTEVETEKEHTRQDYSEHEDTRETYTRGEVNSEGHGLEGQGTSGTGNGNMMQAMPNQNVQGMPYMTMPNGQYMPMMQQGMPMYQNMGMPMNGMQYVQLPNGQYVPMMANNNMLYQQQMLQAQALQQAQQQVALQQQLAQQQVQAAQAAQKAAEQAVQKVLQAQAQAQASQNSAQGVGTQGQMVQGQSVQAATSPMAAPSDYVAGHEGTTESYGAATSSSMDHATAAVAASVNNETHSSADPHTMGEHGAQGNGLPTAGNSFMGAHNSSSSNLPSYMAGVSQEASFNQPRSLSLCSVPRHKFDDWRPGLDLLAVSNNKVETTVEDLTKTSERINEVLHSYGVKATVADYLTGPVITRFDLELAKGVKSSAISSIETELCRNLLVPNVRVVPIIEGSPYVGLEVPNAKRQFITLGDMVSSHEFQDSKATLPMMLGASVVGTPVVKDLAETPHLLVAGTTGSGKSAGLNTMLISLLLKRSPAELRLILVDPKQLEFSIYKDLPHLITPVITDVAEKTSIALNWCVEEMERRFKLMSLLGVRKLSEYNDLVKAEKARGSSIPDPLWTPEMGPVPQGLEPLPWIVVVVEEFADLMAQSARKKDKDKTPEGYIARLTAKSRAAGIHLVLVTQTPRSEVVNGMIKANIPSRIAFTVQNRLDSSIVLDEKGAECLLGNGDMLYKFSGSNTATRAHGSFTSNDDVKRVVSAWRAKAAPEYLADVITAPPDPEAEVEADADSAEQKLDVKFDQAAEIAREYLERRNKPPSITDLQNDLGVGFPRAKKIYKQLIKEGVLEE